MIAERLRKSILQAAIQGKLTKQLPEDGDARDLLKQIRKEKKELIAQGKLKKEKPLPPIADDEIPFDIPDNWVWMKFGDVVSIGSAKRIHQRDWRSSGIPFYRAREIVKLSEDGFVDNELFIDKSFYEEIKEKFGVPQPGDLMVTGVGTLGMSFVIENTEPFYYKDASVLCIFNYGKIDPFYIHYFLKTPLMKEQIDSNSSGTTVGTLTISRFSNYLFCLPPLQEQKRIVKSLNNIFAKIKELDSKENELLLLQTAFPSQMKNAILQYAMEGKLTRQKPEDGNAADLLSDIRKQKAKLVKEGKLKKEKPLPAISDDEIPFDIPENWVWVRLSDIAVINPRNQITDDKLVSFMPMKLLDDGYGSSFTYETKIWNNVKSGFTHFAENDIVFAKITPCFENRKSAIMQNLVNGYGAGTTELHVLRLISSNILKEYLLYFVKSEYFISTAASLMTGTAGQKRVGTNIVKSFLIPLPPLLEQERIVRRLEELLPLCESLE
jgi:type I restriction enzyme S subunit